MNQGHECMVCDLIGWFNSQVGEQYSDEEISSILTLADRRNPSYTTNEAKLIEELHARPIEFPAIGIEVGCPVCGYIYQWQDVWVKAEGPFHAIPEHMPRFEYGCESH